MGRFERLQNWIAEHKILTGMIVLTCGTVVYKGYYESRSMRKTRRARRARNGGRTDVVVIAGSPSLPLTRSLSLDMERRGFIVFIVCNAAEDESMVQAMKRPDVRPLSIDTTDVSLPYGLSCDYTDISLASQCRLCHRTFCPLPPVTSSSWPWNEAQPAHSEIRYPDPEPPLPDVSYRNNPTIQLCRPFQYPPPPAHPYNPGFPTTTHIPLEPHRRKMDSSQGSCLYSLHHFLNQPTISCA